MFKDILKYLRKQEKLSQAELAKKLGVSKSAISMYEIGNRQPDFKTLENIACLFNVDMNFLLDWPENENNNKLSRKEILLLNEYRKMNLKGKNKLLEDAQDMLYNPVYNNNSESELQAAHERTGTKITNEMIKYDNDIMDDPNF